MNYLNLSTIFLDGDAFAGAELEDQAVWINLLRYCAKVENGGRILRMNLWKTRKLSRVIGILPQDLHRYAEGLWSLEGDDVVVHGYPIDQEQKCIKNRENGKLGGRPADPEKPHGKPHGKPDAPPRGKRKERKRKERKRNTSPPSPPSGGTTTADGFGIHPEDLDEYGPAPESDSPDPDPMWDRFLEERESFERFDEYLDRIDGADAPANN